MSLNSNLSDKILGVQPNLWEVPQISTTDSPSSGLEKQGQGVRMGRLDATSIPRGGEGVVAGSCGWLLPGFTLKDSGFYSGWPSLKWRFMITTQAHLKGRIRRGDREVQQKE